MMLGHKSMRVMCMVCLATGQIITSNQRLAVDKKSGKSKAKQLLKEEISVSI